MSAHLAILIKRYYIFTSIFLSNFAQGIIDIKWYLICSQNIQYCTTNEPRTKQSNWLFPIKFATGTSDLCLPQFVYIMIPIHRNSLFLKKHIYITLDRKRLFLRHQTCIIPVIRPVIKFTEIRHSSYRSMKHFKISPLCKRGKTICIIAIAILRCFMLHSRTRCYQNTKTWWFQYSCNLFNCKPRKFNMFKNLTRYHYIKGFIRNFIPLINVSRHNVNIWSRRHIHTSILIYWGIKNCSICSVYIITAYIQHIYFLFLFYPDLFVLSNYVFHS